MSEAADKKKDDPYRATLNLPQTDFAMKANLLQKEPQFQERWEKLGLYRRLLARQPKRGAFVFHDGPPYANGPIHLGHMLNKVLKDLVTRSRTMAGFRVDYVPGWDCHGLPIEHKVMKDLGKEARSMSTLDVRKRCHDYAESYIGIQSAQMKRLGTLARYDAPYLTMDPHYEAGVLEVFAALVEKGLVYRDLKPVHWSIANRTALADAELEYQDRKDPSIYVFFDVEDARRLPSSLGVGARTASLMIWTTTPWTLPANLAVAVGPRGTYAAYEIEGLDRCVVLAEALAEQVLAQRKLSGKKLGACTGEELAKGGVTYRHPFAERAGRVVTAEYVTFEDGTGLVHTAPGHGVEDYQTGLREGLDIYCPVRADGTYDDTVPAFLRGVDVWKANPLVIEALRASSHLFHHFEFTHSYPHDWRSKTPTIFRATEQWFIAVDKPLAGGSQTLRDMALAATDGTVRFVPEWGKNRMRGMLEARPDWCISRQRAWGLPIPAFIDTQGRALLTPRSVRHVAEKVRAHGSDVWFRSSAAELLAGYDPASDPDAPAWARSASAWEKASDIFDVWFESGSSWHAVLRQRDIGYPSELYLEGSDQHRGWFQLSMLPALGATGRPPFKTLLTHGFMVDAQGKKMSKSLGNALEVDTLLKDFGADICRWWVCSLNYDKDIKVDLEFFKAAAEEYRKVRNTLRFLLANLADFDPAKDSYAFGPSDAQSLDAWLMQERAQLVTTVVDAYERYDFATVRHAIFDFCNDTLSAVYLAAAKDRLYCEAKGAPRRRRTQTALYATADALVKLLAPVLVHTADEAFLALRRLPPDATVAVHEEGLPEPGAFAPDAAWAEVMALRRTALQTLEAKKAELGLTNPLDAGVHLTVPSEQLARVQAYAHELADLCGVSRCSVTAGAALDVKVQDLRAEPRCQRSWKRDGTVKQRRDGGLLSQRDAEALGLA